MALGRGRPAYQITEFHEEWIKGLPILARQFVSQDHFSLIGVLGINVTPDVHDTMNVRVNGHGRLTKARIQRQVGGLSSHAGQAQQIVHVVGDLTVKAGYKLLTGCPYELGPATSVSKGP